ncbi:50S ribosomal protein L6 [Glycocaulis sp.]|uniref:50S ribosomal protein L6 n=1 Tax=Glycocaulis sp. TaxID=1969725 RepID=UPI0025B92BE7|nr:50S ribosomal protein L6 [Glycocaulis sp.]MCH8522706.1 50S ribosomal protein L6 [Glycocaulis sp.]
MSRLGKLPVALPSGVSATVANDTVKVKGPKGELSLAMTNLVTVSETEDKSLLVQPADETTRARAMWGTTRANIASMVKGVSEGFEANLELVGVGYRAQVQGRDLKLSLGFSHEVVYTPRQGITLSAPKPTEIKIEGANKQEVGQTAAEIRQFRPPEPYKGKGIRLAGEYVRRKEGKKK